MSKEKKGVVLAKTNSTLGCLTEIFVLVAVSFCLLMMIFVTFQKAPDRIPIDLHDFSGRIFSAHEVKPGTFTVEKDFSEVYHWGDDAIITYQKKGSLGNIYLRAWRPDPQTVNVFQYAEKTIAVSNFTWYLDEIKVNGNTINYFLKKDQSMIIFFTIAMIMTFASIFIGIIQREKSKKMINDL